jgi:hypothetical protein
MLRDRLGADELQLMVVVARLIWLRRNTIIFGGVFSMPAEIVRQGQGQIDSFWEAETKKQLQPASGEITVVQHWKKLAHGIVKLNWDASVDKERHMMGMGIVVRDHEGKFIVGLCASQRYIYDPATAEALAAWKMVNFCITMELGAVCLEGDAWRWSKR